MKKSATVYWLLPAKPERELFCSVIRILRKQFGTPNFEPHLTLFVTTKNRSASAKGQSGSDPKKVLQNIKARPVRLSPRGVAFSEKFTKTLFVRFKSSPALRKLVTQLARGTKSTAKAPRDLHVSLLYKKLPRAAKTQIASSTVATKPWRPRYRSGESV